MTQQSGEQSLRFNEQFHELTKTDIDRAGPTQPWSIVEHTPWRNARQGARLSCMDIREVFARNLRKARNAKGLSQESLAHEASIDRTYVSALERSEYSATIVMVDKLARALGVEASALLQRPTRSRQRRPQAPRS
jgi:ribosome-binding protein aMBF1 (putative translation factor)